MASWRSSSSVNHVASNCDDGQFALGESAWSACQSCLASSWCAQPARSDAPSNQAWHTCRSVASARLAMASVPRHVDAAAPVPHRCRRWHVLGQDHRQRAAGGARRRRAPGARSSSTRTTWRTHDKPFDEREKVNYDHPDAFDWQLLNDHLAALSHGATVPVPVYDFTNHDRSDEVRMVAAGAASWWSRASWCSTSRTLRERFDLKVYIDTDADLRLHPPPARDVAERGRTPESIIAAVPANRCARRTSSSSSPASATPT